MSFMFPHPSLPAPPPPPPAPASLASSSVLESGAAERARLSSAEGQGFEGTDVTQADKGTPETTKSVLGS